MDIKQYIEENLPKCIRVNKEDNGKLIGLPYPYIVPCASGKFQEMYYWDTYFTNKGLLLCGNVELARSNVDNMCYLIRKYGFMLNGNRTTYLYNSQPPFLSMMVHDIYEVTEDKSWLSECFEALEMEHDFWTGKRTYDYVPADLNSLLYALEENLCYFATELEKTEESKYWHSLSEKRAKLCRQYLKNEEGLFMDYNYVKKERNTIVSPACFYPLYCGMATMEEAVAARNMLYRIETEYGILTCERNDVSGNYQWDYQMAGLRFSL